MARCSLLALVLAALAATISAQFGGNFFEQMFQAHQQQAPRENAPSDSNHYQQEYNSGTSRRTLIIEQYCCSYRPTGH